MGLFQIRRSGQNHEDERIGLMTLDFQDSLVRKGLEILGGVGLIEGKV